MNKTDPWKPTAFDRQHMALSLLEQLQRHDEEWVAVRVRGTGWEVVKPRSQEAIVAACDTTAVEPGKSEDAPSPPSDEVERVARAIADELNKDDLSEGGWPEICRNCAVAAIAALQVKP